MMKKISLISFLAVLVAPLLMATQCANPLGPPNTDQGCGIACVVYVNYVDKEGAKITFGTQTCKYSNPIAFCANWIDSLSGKSLGNHDGGHYDLPGVGLKKNIAHTHVLAAANRDGLKHPIIKGVIASMFDYPDGSLPAIKDDIEVYLHYDTPDKAYITLIKINGETKWDRSSFAQDKVPESIIVDLYLDLNRLK